MHSMEQAFAAVMRTMSVLRQCCHCSERFDSSATSNLSVNTTSHEKLSLIAALQAVSFRWEIINEVHSQDAMAEESTAKGASRRCRKQSFDATIGATC